MNTESDHPAPKTVAQEEFLRVFLASEREIYRYVAALVPPANLGESVVGELSLVVCLRYRRGLPAGREGSGQRSHGATVSPRGIYP